MTESDMEIKDILSFDDSKLKTFECKIARMNVGFEDDEGLMFNQIAKDLDIAPQRLVREAMRFFIHAYSVEPETLIEESRRAHERAAEALLFAAHDMKRRHIGPTMQKAAKGEGYPADRIHESEVKDDETFDQDKTKKGKDKA